MESRAERRGQWERKREYILASAGNMVGLGNVWRFPFCAIKTEEVSGGKRDSEVFHLEVIMPYLPEEE